VALAVCLALATGAARGAARSDDQAEMKKIVAKAIKATGGAKNLGKRKAVTIKFKGNVHIDGNSYPFTAEQYIQRPDRQKIVVNVDINGQNFTLIRILNKDKGWVKMGDQETTAMSKSQVKQAKEAVYAETLTTLVPLQKKDVKLSPVGEVTIGKHKAVGIKVSSKGHKDVNMYFDKKTGLLLKTERPTRDINTDKEVSEAMFFDNYKKSDGVQHPTKMQVKHDGKKYVDVDEITEYTTSDKLEDSTFDKP
jgi:hypothetical protein